MANQTFTNKQAREKEIKDIYFTITYNPTAATLELPTTTPITLTKVIKNSLKNGNTFRLVIAAPAANPLATVLAVWTGTAAAVVLTITPNDGTNNGATPVTLTTAEIVELINTDAVVGKDVTVTDASSLSALATAAGGGAEEVADGGEGDLAAVAFAGAIDFDINNQVGFKSFALTATGTIRAALDDKWVALRSWFFGFIDSTARDMQSQVKAYDVNPNSGDAYVDIYTNTGSTPTEMAVGCKMMGTLTLKNTTINV